MKYVDDIKLGGVLPVQKRTRLLYRNYGNLAEWSVRSEMKLNSMK